ncbi:hypothetical protein BH20VER1_BH20VER1_24080 [soil metagenome]
MKILFLTLCIATAAALSVSAGDTPAEKAFVEKYKTAYEANDKATLESFLYKEGAHPMALEFFTMMMTEGAGGKISSIELTDLSPEEMKKAAGTQPGPDGKMTKMPLKPTKKLKVTVETKDANGSGTETTSRMVAEKDGKFVIPVPVPAK